MGPSKWPGIIIALGGGAGLDDVDGALLPLRLEALLACLVILELVGLHDAAAEVAWLGADLLRGEQYLVALADGTSPAREHRIVPYRLGRVDATLFSAGGVPADIDADGAVDSDAVVGASWHNQEAALARERPDAADANHHELRKPADKLATSLTSQNLAVEVTNCVPALPVSLGPVLDEAPEL